MDLLKDDRIRLVVVGVVAVIILGGGNAKADFTFGEPTNLGPMVNSGNHDAHISISDDGLELYFSSARPGGYGELDIWVSKRATTNDGWGEAENLGSMINSSEEDAGADLSLDGLELFFHSGRPGGFGNFDLWVTRRATRNDPWGEPENLGQPINSARSEAAPNLSADGLELYFDFWAPSGVGHELGLYVSKRETIDSPWGEPVSLGSVVNSWSKQCCASISNDGLLLLFSDFWNEFRPGGLGGADLWLTRRKTIDSDWGEPVNLELPVNTIFDELYGTIAPDGSTVYFSSSRCDVGFGNWDIWQAPIIPVVDFDDDGSVAISDLLLLIEAWGKEDSLCDIGPMPWGDGIVDQADLEIFMDYWGQDIGSLNSSFSKIELSAHWKFDEVEGILAYDSAGDNNADLIGDPIWQPSDGIIDGALELDGIDDYVSTPVKLDTSPFSIFAWVRGGAPNQAIIAESQGGVNFLMTSNVGGNLMTVFGQISDRVLFSQTPITDGQWHHVGLVWDAWTSRSRKLYVDGVEVANSILTECPLDSKSPIRIGTAKDQINTGLWSGLIDDVRIYNGALSSDEVESLIQ